MIPLPLAKILGERRKVCERTEVVFTHDHEVTDCPTKDLVHDVSSGEVEVQLVYVLLADLGEITVRAVHVQHPDASHLAAVRGRIQARDIPAWQRQVYKNVWYFKPEGYRGGLRPVLCEGHVGAKREACSSQGQEG